MSTQKNQSTPLNFPHFIDTSKFNEVINANQVLFRDGGVIYIARFKCVALCRDLLLGRKGFSRVGVGTYFLGTKKHYI